MGFIFQHHGSHMGYGNFQWLNKIPIDIPTAFHRHCAFSCSSRSAALGVDALGFFWQRKLGATNIPSELAGWIWMVDFMENLNINMENNMVNTLFSFMVHDDYYMVNDG